VLLAYLADLRTECSEGTKRARSKLIESYLIGFGARKTSLAASARKLFSILKVIFHQTLPGIDRSKKKTSSHPLRSSGIASVI
jgi:hypothetical protein